MNTRPLLYLSCLLAATLTTSNVNAGQRHGGGNRVASRPARGGMARPFAGGGNRMANWSGQRFAANRSWSGTTHWNGQRWNGQNWAGQNWRGQNWNGQHWNGSRWSGNNWNWNHHHHNHNFAFIDFGFPFFGWWGYPYYYDYYPYYSSYGCYPYGYYGSGYYGYGNGFYGSFNYNYGNGYGYDNGYGYGNGYSGGYDEKVAELQRRLANAGYYRGEIDGIFGSRTQYALKAYRHDHHNGTDDSGAYNQHNYPNLRNHPYSPPPTTNEPTPTE